MLRPYQQDAHDKIVAWLRKTTEPCMIEAATGSGKSHIIAALAETVRALSGKNILVLAPSKELVEQNYEKYELTGQKASIFSASAGQKCLDHPVVFGTPMTVKNSIERFSGQFSMVIIDECHGLTPTILDILRQIPNPNLRVVGMSATPYRMGSGYVFRHWANGSQAGREDAYFAQCVYRVTALELIQKKFLTSPVIGDLRADSYKTKDMKLNRMGQFSAEDVDRAYHGQGRKTAKIIADIVDQSRNRKGVLIFAATVKHARECLKSLPPELSALVIGETPKAERAEILRRFKAQELKYIVNVSVLTTGFDATHVDVVAMLRATESASLLQQIIGRGLRLHPGKHDCLVLDYAENIERHCPDGDIFNPEIEQRNAKSSEDLECECQLCGADNVFRMRPNPDQYGINRAGYFVDLDGEEVQGEFGPIPAHFGRRCTAVHMVGNELQKCAYRWTSKECPKCKADNDITARLCSSCGFELVDPNEKLRLSFKARKADPTQRHTDEVLSWKRQPTISKSGKPQYMIKVVTPYRSFTFWVPRMPTYTKGIAALKMLEALDNQPPKTITYRKDSKSGFYEVFGYNEMHDEAPV